MSTDFNQKYLEFLRERIDSAAEERLLALADLLKFNLLAERKLLKPLRTGHFPKNRDNTLRSLAGDVCSGTFHGRRPEASSVALYGSSLYFWCCRAEFGRCDDANAAKACVVFSEVIQALSVDEVSICSQFVEQMVELDTPNTGCCYYSTLATLICLARTGSCFPSERVQTVTKRMLSHEIPELETSCLNEETKQRLLSNLQACTAVPHFEDFDRLLQPLQP
jgi:hypothetical protein